MYTFASHVLICITTTTVIKIQNSFSSKSWCHPFIVTLSPSHNPWKLLICSPFEQYFKKQNRMEEMENNRRKWKIREEKIAEGISKGRGRRWFGNLSLLLHVYMYVLGCVRKYRSYGELWTRKKKIEKCCDIRQVASSANASCLLRSQWPFLLADRCCFTFGWKSTIWTLSVWIFLLRPVDQETKWIRDR